MVTLREFTSEDIPLLLLWAGEGDERELLLWAGPSFTYPLTEGKLRVFLETKRNSRLFIVEHEGNASGIIELGSIDLVHRNARIQKVFIGRREARGKGLAGLAVREVIRICTEELHLHKVTLGVLAGNRIAYRTYVGMGFSVEGIQREYRFFYGQWYDLITMAMFPERDLIPDSRIPARLYETERLVVRTAVPADADAALDYYRRNREFLSTFGPLRPEQFYTRETQEDIILQDMLLERQQTGIRFWIEKIEEPGRFIGNMSFSNTVRGYFQSAYLGYQLDAQEVRNGYMTEALRVMVYYGFTEFKLHRIEANIMPRNEASLATIRRLGFTYEGEAPDYLFIRDAWQTHHHYSLIRES